MTTAAEHSDELRVELLHRIWAHPVRTWSDTLLETIAHAIDLQFGAPPPRPAERHLAVVPELQEPTDSACALPARGAASQRKSCRRGHAAAVTVDPEPR